MRIMFKDIVYILMGDEAVLGKPALNVIVAFIFSCISKFM